VACIDRTHLKREQRGVIKRVEAGATAELRVVDPVPKRVRVSKASEHVQTDDREDEEEQK